MRRLSQMMPKATTGLLLIISIVSGIWAASATDIQSLVAAWRSIPASVILFAVVLVLFGVAASTVRFQAVFRTFNINLRFGVALRANVLGILSGLLFFQIVGQSLARGAILKRDGVSGSAVVLANVYERLNALASLTALAGFSALYLHESAFSFQGLKLSLPTSTGVWAMLGVAVTCITLSWVAIPRRLKSQLNLAFLLSIFRRGITVSAISLLMHLSTLMVFVVLVHALAPDVPLLPLGAAVTLVMFAASMPISFAGWGVREVSAIYILGAVGVPSHVALTASIATGLLSTGVLILTGAAILAADRPRLPARAPEQRAQGSSRAIEHAATYGIPLLTAALIWSHVYLEAGGANINLNVADPFAIMGGLIFLMKRFGRRTASLIWRVPHFEVLLLSLTLVITMALITGWVQNGFSSLAFSTRFAGWFILLAYLGTGALIVSQLGTSGLKILLRALAACGLAVIAFDLGTLFATSHGYVSLPGYGPTMRGLTQNANAFALEVMVLLVILGVSSGHTHRLTNLMKRDWVLASMLALCALAINYSASRTGAVTAVLLAGVLILMGRLKLRTVAFAGIIATGYVFLPDLLRMLQGMMGDGTGALNNSAFAFVVQGRDSSDNERMFSIMEGVKLWLAHPVFGGGLGAFAKLMEQQNHAPLIIHNSAVWLLAETGLIGFATFAVAFAVIGKAAWQSACRGELEGEVLLLTLAVFLLFQAPHDVLFQRILWFILGATVACGMPRSAKSVAIPSNRSSDVGFKAAA